MTQQSEDTITKIQEWVQRVLAEWEIDIPDEVTRTSGAMTQ